MSSRRRVTLLRQLNTTDQGRAGAIAEALLASPTGELYEAQMARAARLPWTLDKRDRSRLKLYDIMGAVNDAVGKRAPGAHVSRPGGGLARVSHDPLSALMASLPRVLKSATALHRASVECDTVRLNSADPSEQSYAAQVGAAFDHLRQAAVIYEAMAEKLRAEV